MQHCLRTALLILFALALPCASFLATTSAEDRQDHQKTSRLTESQLTGPEIIRRDVPEDLPRMLETQTLMVQGVSLNKADGICSYSLEFYEPFNEASPKFGWLTAVDPTTCRFEFQIGVLAETAVPKMIGGDSSHKEVEAKKDASLDKPDAEALGSNGQGDSQEWDVLPEPPTDAARNKKGRNKKGRKMTVYGSWQDPDPFPSIELTKVLTAVKSRLDGKRISGGRCAHDRWWRTATGWADASSGKWNNTYCGYTKHHLFGATNGRFENSSFPACWGEKAFIYYDDLWAKVTTTKDPFPAGYYYGVRGTWADGSRCAHLLKWSAWAFYPGEYWKNGFD